MVNRIKVLIEIKYIDSVYHPSLSLALAPIHFDMRNIQLAHHYTTRVDIKM